MSTRERSLKSLFEAQVRRRPDETAVICRGRGVSFGELNRRANQLASRLRRHGVGIDVPVGISVPRSIEMVIGVIGIAKAGGAYLPLDPGYPPDRLVYMAEDSQIRVVVTCGGETRLKERLSLRDDVEVVDLGAESIRAEPATDLFLDVPPDVLAYVIYTSGSTGTPKGVLGTHRGMLNRLQWMWERFPFRNGEVCCVKTSLNFLDSFCEIYGPLLQGIPVVVVPDEIVKDAEQLAGELERSQVTRLVLVPSLLRSMLSTVPEIGRRLQKVTFWVSSGEPLPVDLVQAFQVTFPQARLLNLYGSSELSADCTWYDTTEASAELVAIGRPISENGVHILDSDLQRLPAGTAGQLYVSGVGLARGYLDRPHLTAESFLPDPYGPPGSRMYRTGDVCRLRADGALEYLGRADHQVKIRGFRVEPGEIEAELARHPSVGHVVVVAREDRLGQKQLVGYVVRRAGASMDAGELRQYVESKLPAHMVPASIVELASLPLTPSGKLDRMALPAPRFESAGREPRTDDERILAAIFSEVLDLKSVSIDDNFFEIGGDSMISMQLVGRARKAGFSITAHDVFRHPSIAALALAVKRPC
jgi:amino acid adenylation domain-containing protein